MTNESYPNPPAASSPNWMCEACGRALLTVGTVYGLIGSPYVWCSERCQMHGLAAAGMRYEGPRTAAPVRP